MIAVDIFIFPIVYYILILGSHIFFSSDIKDVKDKKGNF